MYNFSASSHPMKMKSKFIIFVAFATLMQSSCAEQSTEEESSGINSVELRTIINNEDMALSSNMDALGPVFDVLEIFSTMRKYNLQCKDDVYSLVTQGLLRAKKSCDKIFDSIPMILGKNCSAKEIAHNASYADFENVYAQVRSAIELAVSGNYTDIGTEFEVFIMASNKSLGDIIKRIYDTIRTCVSTTNNETLAEIKVRENGSLNGLLSANDAVFDAIKIFAAGIPAEGDDVAIVPDIKVYRKRAASGVGDVVEHTFSPIRGLYMSTQLNLPEVGANLTSDQYAQIVSESRYRGAIELVFDVIKGYLTKVRIGLSDGCNDDSSAIDAAQAESAASFKIGIDSLLDSIPIPDPETAATVKTKIEYFNNFLHKATATYYNSIKLARNPKSSYCKTLKKLKAVEAEIQDAFPNFVHTIFSAVKLGSDTEDRKLANFENNVAAAGRTCVENIYTALRLMAKACRGIKVVSQDDFDKLQNARNTITTAVGNFSSNVSSGHVSVIQSSQRGQSCNRNRHRRR